MTQDEIAKAIADHRKWLLGQEGGAGADLTGADLTGAVLTGADLTGADLTGAVLTRADLTGAVLTDAKGISAPTIPHIDAVILAAVERDGCELDMSDWHHCETSHCRAGWAVVLAGPAGRMLEDRIGSGPAGSLIYAASRPGKPIPDFYCGTDDALADLRKCAAEDPLPAGV